MCKYRADGFRHGVLSLLVCFIAACSIGDGQPDFEQPQLIISDARLSHPSDIIKFNDRFVATELYNNRLVMFDDLELNGLAYFDPQDIDRQFASPHFLAVSPQNTLLISNGWGSSIVEIADLTGRNWKEFHGVGLRFSAPHGLCVDEDGWIYVGDSLNSRLVRFRDMTGLDWQVFGDTENRISYIRELVCHGGAVWASNSYEKRAGLNPGEGSNILKITDFESGTAEVVFSISESNMTALLPMEKSNLFGLWGRHNRLAITGHDGGEITAFPAIALGTPYGTFFDSETGMVLVAYIGFLSNPNNADLGGIAGY